MTSITATADAVPPSDPAAQHGAKDRLPILMLGAIGVVYGDIGTSPLYTMKESFLGPHPLAVDPLHIFGVLSLIFWSLMLIVTVKYVFIAMRADNRGEGGSFEEAAPAIRARLVEEDVSRRIEGWVKELRQAAEIRYNLESPEARAGTS